MSKRGRVAMPLALGWRATRGGTEALGRVADRKAELGDAAKQAFKELCTYLDKCNAEDRAAGRPPMVEYLASAFAWSTGGVRWVDR